MELLEKYDNKRRALGKVEERYVNVPGEYCLVVHLWIINDKGEFLMQKRSPNKKTHPNVWSVTGGANNPGETTLQTVIRETKEELGVDIDISCLELMLTIKRKSAFFDIWLLKQNIDLKDIVMQEEEVSEVKWVTLDELKDMINKKEVTPSIGVYLNLFENLLKEQNEF